MIASAMVIVRHFSPSLIFIRLDAMRLNTARRFSSPRCLPLGLPLWPFWKRVALGGFPYPTSEDASDAPELILFMKFPFLGPLISGKSKIAAVFVALHRTHWLRFKVYCLDDRRSFSSLETRKIQKFKKSSEGLLVAG